MQDEKKETILKILNLIDDDWAVIDLSDEDDFVVFVNSARERIEDFFPKRDLIIEMQQLGYLYPIEPLKREMETYNTFDENANIIEVTKLSSLIYFFKITSKGEIFLTSRKH